MAGVCVSVCVSVCDEERERERERECVCVCLYMKTDFVARLGMAGVAVAGGFTYVSWHSRL